MFNSGVSSWFSHIKYFKASELTVEKQKIGESFLVGVTFFALKRFNYNYKKRAFLLLCELQLSQVIPKTHFEGSIKQDIICLFLLCIAPSQEFSLPNC